MAWAQRLQAAGYKGAVVFNRTGQDGCETLISMLAEANIPAVFVSRTDGFRILGASLNGYTCSEDGSGTASPAVGTDSSTVNLNAVFDGWGYIHLFDAATMEDLDQFAIPEAHDPAHAENSGGPVGARSCDRPGGGPRRRVLLLGRLPRAEPRRRRPPRGGDVHRRAGDDDNRRETRHRARQQLLGRRGPQAPERPEYVLASDRDSGVWIFQYRPSRP